MDTSVSVDKSVGVSVDNRVDTSVSVDKGVSEHALGAELDVLLRVQTQRKATLRRNVKVHASVHRQTHVKPQGNGRGEGDAHGRRLEQSLFGGFLEGAREVRLEVQAHGGVTVLCEKQKTNDR